MTISFPRLDPAADATALADFLSGDTWPFHAGGPVGRDTVLERVAGGAYDGEETRTFWIADGGDRAGLIRLMDLGDDTPLFDLRIGSPHRGRGLGTRAVRWLTSYLFEEFPAVRRVEGTTRRDNAAMRRVFARCGYAKEAHYRDAWPDVDGGLHDSVGYAVLRRDWAAGTVTPVEWEG